MSLKDWNQQHLKYVDKEWINKPSLFSQEAIKFFPSAGNLIDIGCGQGQDSRFFSKQGYQVTGIDFSEEGINFANKKSAGMDIDFRILDIAKPLPFEDSSFDIVYSHLALHYFDNATTELIFNELKRILNPGGILAILVNSIHDPQFNTGEKVEEDYFVIGGMLKRYFRKEKLLNFSSGLETLILDENGETYVDWAVSVSNLIRFIGKKLLSPARVISEHRELYKVKNQNGEFSAKITGKQIFGAKNREDYPAVGDWVLVNELDNQQAIIEKVLPRQSIIKRKFGDKNKQGEKSNIQIIATNIDVGFVVEAVDRDYSLNRFERYFSILSDGGVKGAIILNKIDLLSPEERESKLSELRNRFPSTDIIVTSTVNDKGLDVLKNYIEKDKTYCFLGSSGVGKSTLINRLLGEDIIKTGDISSYSVRGKHTTTGRQMYFLDGGGIVIDNPGIREVGMSDIGEGINNFFEEITSLEEECRFVDCTHTHEPGCVVLDEIEKGNIDKEKYTNYTNLKKEAEYFNMTEDERRKKNKDFGKFIKKAKKELGDFGNDNYQ